MTTYVIALTSGTSWTVPSDWNNANNSVECIGGGGGSGNQGGSGGGGGAYSKSSNLTLTPGNSIPIAIGAGGSAGAAGTSITSGGTGGTVSYTHLTLPTNREV